MNAARALSSGLLVALLLGVAATSVEAQQRQRQRVRQPPPPLNLPAAAQEQIDAAALTHQGPYECEFDEKLSVDANATFNGYLDVKHRKHSWVMKPVRTSTGAVRLEDVAGRMLLLQIAEKSMLMDTQVGQRVVDNCVHQKHREAMAVLRDDSETLGIDPARVARAASAAAARAAASAPAVGAVAPAGAVGTLASAGAVADAAHQPIAGAAAVPAASAASAAPAAGAASAPG